MSLRWCESPGNAARIAALSAEQAPTAIIGCPHHHVRGFYLSIERGALNPHVYISMH